MSNTRTLTLQTLKDKKACTVQLLLFKQLFGESVEISESACILVADKFDWNWAANKLLSTSARKAYNEATASALKAYCEAKASAGKAYYEATAPAWQAYCEVSESAGKAYYEATAPALKAYCEVSASAGEAYDEAKASAGKAYYEARASAFAKQYIKESK
jgi:hypothetical protein